MLCTILASRAIRFIMCSVCRKLYTLNEKKERVFASQRKYIDRCLCSYRLYFSYLVFILVCVYVQSQEDNIHPSSHCGGTQSRIDCPY